MKNIFFAALFTWLCVACGARNISQAEGLIPDSVLFPEDFVEHPIVLPYSEIVSCPQGWMADEDSHLCVRGSEARGPFTKLMTHSCRERFSDSNFCDLDIWPLSVAQELRGMGECLAGASLSSRGECVEDGFQYGPFRREFVEKCYRYQEQKDCAALRWSESAYDLREDNEKLEAYYPIFGNYLSVYDDVASWFAPINGGSTTRNGCVAFLSTALRHVGVQVPIDGVIAGKGVSINTEGFEAYLRDSLFWEGISDAAELLPGDLVISQDREGVPGHPDHVYMFHGWQDKVTSVAWVIDNQVDPDNRQQMYIHRRNVVADQEKLGKTPYARHYRSREPL